MTFGTLKKGPSVSAASEEPAPGGARARQHLREKHCGSAAQLGHRLNAGHIDLADLGDVLQDRLQLLRELLEFVFGTAQARDSFAT